MAKKQPAAQPRRKRSDSAEEPKRRLTLEERREADWQRKYTLTDCMKFGKAANILFVVFIIVCLIYYYSIAQKGNYSIPFEVVAYTIETTAFGLFLTSVIWIDRLVRARRSMKILLITYIAAEVLLMLLEFQLLPFIPYNGLSVWLIILHVLFSAGVSFSLLTLDPQNKNMQIIVTITTVIVLAGMLTAIAGYRVYASILINAFAYIFFFVAMEHLLRLEEISIDCYGDRAKVDSFDSTMFANTPTMIEKPLAEKKTIAEKAKRLAADLSSEEHAVLTDKDEKFEYEFGVDDDDDDDDEDDAE